ncbi:MAG: hypothetical protein EZS28_007461 [Streblomastix strix]|uniref:MYND-type domain-containing protein n=1 Tax=Streblomastix strix TaxID=222440 RepID=A0A5J4WSD3_9EUKA|nr:MAG: hypothetical protein EZS28_007461 [Streblomastix strix]
MTDSGKKNICEECSKAGIMQCGNCKSVFYCSREHQIKNWQLHKLKCNILKQQFFSKQEQQQPAAKPVVKPIEKPVVKPFEKTVQLFVYNLSSITTEKQLQEQFSKVGTVVSVFLPYSRTIKRGFGFITMKYNYSNQAQLDKSNDLSGSDEILDKLTNIINNTLNYEQQVRIIKDPSFQITPGANESQNIEQIFASNDLNDDEKAQKLNNLYIQYQKEINEKLLLIFEVETLSVIQSRLNNCSTASERVLMNIVDLITERNAFMPTIQDISIVRRKTILLTDIRKSYLDTKIERILRIKFAEDEKNEIKQYSELTEQLVRIFLNIHKGQDIGPDMIEISVSVIVQMIISQEQGSIKQNDDEQGKMEKDISIIDDEERNRKLDSFRKIINALGGASRFNLNNQQRIIDLLKSRNCVEFILNFNCENDPIAHDGKVSPQLRDFHAGIQKILKKQLNKDPIEQEQEQKSKQQEQVQEQKQSKGQEQFNEQIEDEEEQEEKDKYEKMKSDKDKREKQEEDGEE